MFYQPVVISMVALLAAGPLIFSSFTMGHEGVERYYPPAPPPPHHHKHPKPYNQTAEIDKAVQSAIQSMASGPKDLSDIPALPTRKSPSTLPKKYGYPSKGYRVKTSDGYILRLDRIPNPGKPAVLIPSALLCSSGVYMLLGNQSLAMKLYDQGFDVWLGNLRGNGVSVRHEKYTTDDKEFWDFGLDEHALKDIPALIDFILKKTGESNLTYVGYSMSSTLFYIFAAEKPEYCTRVKAAFLMAPPVYLQNATSFAVTVGYSYANQSSEILSNVTGRCGVTSWGSLYYVYLKRACPVLNSTLLSCGEGITGIGGTGELVRFASRIRERY